MCDPAVPPTGLWKENTGGDGAKLLREIQRERERERPLSSELITASIPCISRHA